jgi:hypothetical protein
MIGASEGKNGIVSKRFEGKKRKVIGASFQMRDSLVILD